MAADPALHNGQEAQPHVFRAHQAAITAARQFCTGQALEQGQLRGIELHGRTRLATDGQALIDDQAAAPVPLTDGWDQGVTASAAVLQR